MIRSFLFQKLIEYFSYFQWQVYNSVPNDES